MTDRCDGRGVVCIAVMPPDRRRSESKDRHPQSGSAQLARLHRSPQRSIVRRNTISQKARRLLFNPLRAPYLQGAYPMKSHSILGLLKRTVVSFIARDTLQMGAALAYYTIFSLAPLVLIAVWIAGLFF